MISTSGLTKFYDAHPAVREVTLAALRLKRTRRDLLRDPDA
jgi:hypothetical protein